jgi:hypothetical protein
MKVLIHRCFLPGQQVTVTPGTVCGEAEGESEDEDRKKADQSQMAGHDKIERQIELCQVCSWKIGHEQWSSYTSQVRVVSAKGNRA